jgi:hypothetical protein
MSTIPEQGKSKGLDNPSSSPRRHEAHRGAIDWSGIFGYDIFVSYKRADASGFAAALAHELHQRDIDAFSIAQPAQSAAGNLASHVAVLEV